MSCYFHVVNFIPDCASAAALAALAHFKRPDVTTTGSEIIVHSHAERDPIPIVLHHYPVSVSYAIYHNGYVGVILAYIHTHLPNHMLKVYFSVNIHI